MGSLLNLTGSSTDVKGMEHTVGSKFAAMMFTVQPNSIADRSGGRTWPKNVGIQKVLHGIEETNGNSKAAVRMMLCIGHGETGRYRIPDGSQRSGSVLPVWQ